MMRRWWEPGQSALSVSSAQTKRRRMYISYPARAIKSATLMVFVTRWFTKQGEVFQCKLQYQYLEIQYEHRSGEIGTYTEEQQVLQMAGS